ncbi:MAG: zinc ribbon domain-containing protein [Planctomycetota bacterium]|jgi:putative FmdB family regulatory protein|nr:zinc ribbon domain-containing protein [Planctomycetota bacterium]
MPTYEYECGNCGHSFEEFQYMSDKPLRKCPKCAKLNLVRLIGAGAGIIFKGSGFYETDYKRKGEAKPADKPSSDKGSDANKPDAKAPAASGDAPSAAKPPAASEVKPAKAS